MKKVFGIFVITISLFSASPSYAWHDRTHIAVAKAAGYEYWFNAAGADITKTKAGDIEAFNHFFNNNDNLPVTEQMVNDQVKRYNSPSDEEGHLYGAIIAAIHDYHKQKSKGKYGEYSIAFAAHYIGDLSQPLHNVPYDAFNKSHHVFNDAAVESEVLNNVNEIEKNMYQATLRPEHFEEDLAREIARIANISRQLGAKLKAEDRNLTKDEAYVQLGHSASLLKAVLNNISGESVPISSR